MVQLPFDKLQTNQSSDMFPSGYVFICFAIICYQIYSMSSLSPNFLFCYYFFSYSTFSNTYAV